MAARTQTTRSAELEAWDTPIASELRELVELHDRGRLSALDEYRPFHFKEAFFTKKNAFNDYLLQAQEFGWPVYYLAHFAGLYPIGATGDGDYWLARVSAESNGTSRVYRYEHETGELVFVFGRSPISCVARATRSTCTDFVRRDLAFRPTTIRSRCGRGRAGLRTSSEQARS